MRRVWILFILLLLVILYQKLKVSSFIDLIKLKRTYRIKSKYESSNKPRIIKEWYSQKIPFKIHQTSFSKKMDYKLAAANMNNHYINPEYDYYFYDEADCVRFIKENYPQYIKHYNTLVPGAYKADLFRLLVLQKEGGVYIDDKTSCKIPLREIIQPEDELILVKDNLPGQIYQGVIFSTQGHFLLEKFIQRYIRNIESRYYGVDAYDIGGPKMFGRVLNTYLGQSEEYAFDSFTKDGIRVEGTTYYVMGQGNDSLALGVDIIASDKQVFWFERSNSAYISRKLKQALSGREYQTLWLLRKVYR